MSVSIVDKLSAYHSLAEAIFQSGFFKHIGGAQAILTILLMAEELKIGPMEALMGGINVISGKAEVSPRLMNKLIRQAGHKILTVEHNNVSCLLKGVRADNGQEEIAAFTIDDAKRAGIYRMGGPWEKYPMDMLFARCISRLARRLFPDVISTAYVQGELDEEDSKDEIPEEEQKPAPALIGEEEYKKIEDLLKEEDAAYKNRLLEYFKVQDFKKLPKESLDKCLNAINKRISKKNEEGK